MDRAAGEAWLTRFLGEEPEPHPLFDSRVKEYFDLRYGSSSEGAVTWPEIEAYVNLFGMPANFGWWLECHRAMDDEFLTYRSERREQKLKSSELDAKRRTRR